MCCCPKSEKVKNFLSFYECLLQHFRRVKLNSLLSMINSVMYIPKFQKKNSEKRAGSPKINRREIVWSLKKASQKSVFQQQIFSVETTKTQKKISLNLTATSHTKFSWESLSNFREIKELHTIFSLENIDDKTWNNCSPIGVASAISSRPKIVILHHQN